MIITCFRPAAHKSLPELPRNESPRARLFFGHPPGKPPDGLRQHVCVDPSRGKGDHRRRLRCWVGFRRVTVALLNPTVQFLSAGRKAPPALTLTHTR